MKLSQLTVGIIDQVSIQVCRRKQDVGRDRPASYRVTRTLVERPGVLDRWRTVIA